MENMYTPAEDATAETEVAEEDATVTKTETVADMVKATAVADATKILKHKTCGFCWHSCLRRF